jgi:hypothetical protein
MHQWDLSVVKSSREPLETSSTRRQRKGVTYRITGLRKRPRSV